MTLSKHVRQWTDHLSIDDDIQAYEQTFIFNPTDNMYNEYNLVFRKFDEFHQYYKIFSAKPVDNIERKSLPGFIQNLTEKKELLSKVDYIIDLLGIGTGFRFLILFNIDGIPKFCITGSDLLSDEV